MEDQQSSNQQPVVYSSMPENGESKSKLKIIGIVLALLLVLALIVFFTVQSHTKKTASTTKANYKTSSVSEAGLVTISKDGFSPATLKIKKGQSVEWTNKDDALHQIAADPHPTHSSIPELFSDPLNKGESYAFTFDTSGSFTYHDEMNPLTVLGTIIVE